MQHHRTVLAALIFSLFIFTYFGFPPQAIGQPNVFYSQTLTLPGQPQGCPFSQQSYVHNSAGGNVKGVILSNQKIDFFILNSTEYQQLQQLAGSTCKELRPKFVELGALGITKYSVNWNVPDNGNHYFVFFNPYEVDSTVSVTLAWGN